jgi:hypothetical protein
VFNFGVEIGVLALQRQIADYQIPSKVAAADLEIRVPGIRPMNPHPARDQEYRGSNHDCRTRVQPCHPFGFPYLRASGRSGRPVPRECSLNRSVQAHNPIYAMLDPRTRRRYKTDSPRGILVTGPNGLLRPIDMV